MKSFSILVSLLLLSGVLYADDRLGLPPLTIPADNPQSPQKIALGQQLFNDRRLSGDGTVSCASCHPATRAFSDGRQVAQGIGGQRGIRNTPTVVNAAFYSSLFVDGRRPSLETQALDPLLNPIEHGLSDDRAILAVIRQDPQYRRQFKQVFAVAPQQITPQHIAQAIASYERTLIYGDSPFDRYFFGGDKTALSPAAARGLNIFRRKGNCANCHEISWNNALFSDNRFYNIGIGYQRVAPLVERYGDKLAAHIDNNRQITAMQRSELGRFNLTHTIADIGQFKTPSLRNVALTGPYMHDGSLETLAEVIEYYDRGGHPNPFLDPAIFPLMLTAQEKTDLVEFLKALTSRKFK